MSALSLKTETSRPTAPAGIQILTHNEDVGDHRFQTLWLN